MQFNTRNVNTAFRDMIQGFTHPDKVVPRFPMRKSPSRNGDVIMVDEPITVTYERPLERVLHSRVRDCNPFFHLYEALWMLAGRNDVAPLAFYNSNIANYSDDGSTFNGAYGYRWRHGWKHEEPVWSEHFGQNIDVEKEFDQLNIIVDHLKKDPTSRRVVLQMWNIQDDLLKIGPDIQHPDKPCGHCNGTGIKPGTESIGCQHCVGTKIGKKAWTEVRASKDVCCNTNIYFMGRPIPHPLGAGVLAEDAAAYGHAPQFSLEMTVCNRSNDLVWGMLGANVVHMSFLQEYMAAQLGWSVGKYHQITNNLHAYLARWTPDEWLKEYQSRNLCSTCFKGAQTMRDYVTQGDCAGCGKRDTILRPQSWEDVYDRQRLRMVPLVKDPSQFELELPEFVERNSNGADMAEGTRWQEPFLDGVAQPMCLAYKACKENDATETKKWIAEIAADDWRVAADEWTQRRFNKRKTGNATTVVS